MLHASLAARSTGESVLMGPFQEDRESLIECVWGLSPREAIHKTESSVVSAAASPNPKTQESPPAGCDRGRLAKRDRMSGVGLQSRSRQAALARAGAAFQTTHSAFRSFRSWQRSTGRPRRRSGRALPRTRRC
jgi:hypothetical protein